MVGVIVKQAPFSPAEEPGRNRALHISGNN
jgi:hypothetical protein